MAFRLMRYAIAAMQRHLDAGHKTLPLVVPMLFITARPVRIPFPSTGWMNLPTRRWRGRCTPARFRWLT
jgi:hypothetical protein